MVAPWVLFLVRRQSCDPVVGVFVLVAFLAVLMISYVVVSSGPMWTTVAQSWKWQCWWWW
jgi:hypothetical protein